MIDDIKIGFFEGIIMSLSDFVQNWICPAYSLRNVFFKRYDLVRLPIKRSHYCDVTERMYLANMALIRFFIEKEQPEKHVEWYGVGGHRYGECKNILPMMFPEYEGVYIMDIIKEIYEWDTKGIVKMTSEFDYANDFWIRYLRGKAVFTPAEDGYEIMTMDKSGVPSSLDFFDGKNVNWEIIEKICPKEKVLEGDTFFKKMIDFENGITALKQKYLHLCIEVREYLWT